LDALKTKIEIIDLHVPARIGCLENERSKPQDIAFDIIIYFDATTSCKTDRLEDTIDYLAIRQLIYEMCEKNVVSLIEKLAWKCVEQIFERFPSSEEIHFKIKKFSTMPDAANIGFGLVARRP
jgi:dihydroneopterin aldolase